MAMPDRETIRKVVVEVLARWLENPGTNIPKAPIQLLVLHEVGAALSEEFHQNVTALTPYFTKVTWQTSPSPSPTVILAPDINPQTAAEIANGTFTSRISEHLLKALSHNTPIWISSSVEQIPAPFADNNPALSRVIRGNRYATQTLGIRFSPQSYVQEIISFLTPEINLTPARLAATRPAQVREFLTTEDIYEARYRNKKNLTLGPLTSVTEEAKELADRFGITITE